MNRTPRSASRRASRQFAANEPSAPFVPYISSTWAGSLGDVHQVRHAGLHLESHFVLGDAGLNFRIVDRGVVNSIERLGRLDHVVLPLADRRPAGC